MDSGYIFDDNCIIMYENPYYYMEKITVSENRVYVYHTTLILTFFFFFKKKVKTGWVGPSVLMHEIDVVQWGGGKFAM